MISLEEKEALFNLTKSRIDISGSFLELLLMIPEEFSKHISVENEELMKKDLVSNLNDKKFNVYEFEELKRKYVLIFILREFKKSLAEYSKESEVNLIDRIEFLNKEIFAKELSQEEEILKFFQKDFYWEGLNLMTNHWKEAHVDLMILKQKRDFIWDILTNNETPIVKIAKILL